MRIRWVKVWVDAMASLTERFRDEEGRVDFEALGREEYAFRHALVTGDFSRSERARDLYDATINEITSRSEAGRKGAEARWSKKTAAATTRDGVDVVPDRESGSLERATGCNPLTADAPHREAGENVTDGSNSGTLESGTSANNMRRVPQNEAPAHGFSGGRTAQGTMSHAPSVAAQDGKFRGSAKNQGERNTGSTVPAVCPESGNIYNQEPYQVSTDEDRQSQNGAGEVTPESVSAPSPSLPAKHPHGEFGNVMLTTDEYIKLCEKCQDADSLITELDQYIESQGKTKKYKSHYATLLNWSRRKAQESKPKQGYMTSDDISKKNYEESKARLEAMFSKGRVTA